MNLRLWIFRRFAFGILVTSALLLSLAGCADKLVISNRSGNDVGFLVDGQDSGGSFNDRGFLTGVDFVSVGELTASPSSNEATGFTNHRPARYTATPWTNNDDTFNVNFQARIQVPVTVWIIKGPFNQQRDHAIEACIRTSAIWNAERMGVAFSQFRVIDATADPQASDHFAFPNGDVGDSVWKPLRDDIGFTVGRLNIYWVDTVNGSTTTGWSNFGPQIVMGRNTGDELLSHEIGHAFSLTHTNGVANFDQTNIMHNASNTREFITEGQLFRAHLDPDSILNLVYGARPGEITRNCGFNGSSLCPDSDRRLWADGAFSAN
ncbi:MAG: hypothetical protein KJO91_03035 [Gammaproteobacteria bacterium]|nr:hypothetical protein [Gammaproteobacteria bacterium]